MVCGSKYSYSLEIPTHVLVLCICMTNTNQGETNMLALRHFKPARTSFLTDIMQLNTGIFIHIFTCKLTHAHSWFSGGVLGQQELHCFLSKVHDQLFQAKVVINVKTGFLAQ